MSLKQYIKERTKILVPGYGSMEREQLQSQIKKTFEDVQKKLDENDYESVYSLLYKHGVFQSFLETEIKERKNGIQ